MKDLKCPYCERIVPYKEWLIDDKCCKWCIENYKREEKINES